MQIIKRSFQEVPQFSERDRAYTLGDQSLRNFYAYQVDLDTFEQVIDDRKKMKVNRELLVTTLKAQLARYVTKAADTEKLVESLLNENTFTVITAHQPSLFTGPLYFIYKIISTIRLSRELKSAYPAYNFVPVFISGGEDHDFEEINHLNIFGKTLKWENDASGPTGKMETDTLQKVLGELGAILGESDAAKKVYEQIKLHYGSGKNYGRATLSFVNDLFGKYGLVVASMDESDFKRAFIPAIKKEIFEQLSASKVQETQEALSDAGFKSQAHAREINFFYMEKGIRERIVEENGSYQVLNTALSFSKTELEKLIEDHPEKFSPNVVMRPLYQETIMPNLAYIGGGGELAYWLERKSQFQTFDVFYPMLIRRNSVLWVDKGNQKKINKLGLSIIDFFDRKDRIIKKFVSEQAETELDFSSQLSAIEKPIDEIIALAKKVDPTLAKSSEAEKVRLLKQVDQMTSRIKRAEKQKHEVGNNQIEKIKEKLFPNNGLQERVDNFIPFYLKHGDKYFDVLLEHLNPLEKEMVIVVEE